MKTLHMYHWYDKKTLSNNVKLMGPNDSLVIYGNITDVDLLSISAFIGNLNYNCYVVNNEQYPHNNIQVINEDQWLELIISHEKTLTWK